jgi:hypothetical protein
MKNFIGFGRRDISPKEPQPLAGYGNCERRMPGQIVKDPLYTTCIAVSDENGSTVLIFTMDLIHHGDRSVNAIREAIEKKLGIPGSRVMLQGTHTHSAPDLWASQMECMSRYLEQVVTACVEAAKEALADRSEAEIYYGSAETVNLNFVKHYQHTTADGEIKYFGDNFGTQVLDETTRHITDADPTMHLLKIVRSGKKDIIMANWRAHATLTGGLKKPEVSADFPGAFREVMEQQLGCLFAFHQGAAGNLNAATRLRDTEERTRDYKLFGKFLAEHALEGLQNMKKLPGGAVRIKNYTMMGKVDHSEDYRIEDAKKVVKVWVETSDYAAVKEVAAPLGIRSPYKATAICRRYNGPQELDLELNTITVGEELAFITAPNELFDTISVMVEEGSPYAQTLTLGYCNAYRGYIPSKLGYEYTCYESDATWFEPGIGEKIAEQFIKMLKEMKG